MTGFLDMVI